MNVNQRSKRQILGVSINPQLYKKLKEECNGKNISAFVEKAISKELAEKELEQKEFRKKLIADYKSVARSKIIQKEVAIWDETLNDAWNTKHSSKTKKNE